MVQTLHSLTFVHIDTSLGERLVLRQTMIHWVSSDMGFPWGIDGGRTQTHGMVQHEVQMMIAYISWTEKTDTEQFQCVSLCISVILNWYLLLAYHNVCLQPLYLQKSIQVFTQSKTHFLPILSSEKIIVPKRKTIKYIFIIQTSITAPTDHAPKLERRPLLLPLLCLTHHPQSQESPQHIIKMSLPSNKHITVWLQLPWSPALTATVSTIPLHRSPYHHLQHLINPLTNPIPCLKTQ